VKTFVNRIDDTKKINGGTPLTYTENTPLLLFNLDPFFTSTDGAQYASSMQADLQSYTDRVLILTGSTYSPAASMPKFIKFLLTCGQVPNTTSNWNTCTPTCRAMEKEFNLYRDMYFQLKEIYYQKAMKLNKYCGGAGCAIGQPIVNPLPTASCATAGSFRIAEDTISADGQSKLFRIIYDGFSLPTNTTVNLNYAPGITSYKIMVSGSVILGLPVTTKVVFTAGQKFAYIKLPLKADVSSVSIRSVDCQGISNPYAGQKYIDYKDIETEYLANKMREYQGWWNGHVWVNAPEVSHLTTVTIRDAYGNEVTSSQAVTVTLNFKVNTPHSGKNHDYGTIDKPFSVQLTIPAGQASVSYPYKLVHSYYTPYPNAFVQADAQHPDRTNPISIPSGYYLYSSAVQISQPAPCEPGLATKNARFPVTPDDALAVIQLTTSQNSAAVAADAANRAALFADNAENIATMVINKLTPGIANKGLSGSIASLKIKLKEVVIAGSDEGHLMGSSVLTGTTTTSSGNHSFGDAIKQALPLTYFTPTINPWLVSYPFPYDKQQQNVVRTIGSTTVDMCTKLNSLKSEYEATLTGGQTYSLGGFYSYLTTKFGAGMNITQLQLSWMFTSCATCNDLMPSAVQLPAFMEPFAQGYITKAAFNTAKNTELPAQFNDPTAPLLTTDANYQTIFTNFMNMKWGFNLSYNEYMKFNDNPSSTAILVNNPKFTSGTPDPFACANAMLDNALASGSRDYDRYIALARDVFKVHYIATCSKAKAYSNIKTRTIQYQRTLYYYDQADNLVRTIPPEGVSLVPSEQFAAIDNARDNEPDAAYTYNGPIAEGSQADALLKLENALISTQSAAVEMWLYNATGNNYQFTGLTPGTIRKYLYQVGIKDNMLFVDIYPASQDAAGSITFVPATSHYTADISALLPLNPFVHLVFQGPTLEVPGNPQIYLNGTALVVNNNPTVPSPFGFNVVAGSTTLSLPSDFSQVKHLVFYAKQLTSANISADAADTHFNISDGTYVQRYRFNLPALGGPTTTGPGSLDETTNANRYPLHTMATSYNYNSTNQVTQQYSPDGGLNNFWYDLLSRLVISQNAKQKPLNKYSYTKYDPQLGRVTEVGQKTYTGAMGDGDYLAATDTRYTGFSAAAGGEEITNTWYDSKLSNITVPGILDHDQNNLRKRVAVSYYRKTLADQPSQATYYNYDVTGNVTTLWQQIEGLGEKRLDYEFDLVSGKVDFLRYQDQNGAPDQFFYSYEYDAENRLTDVYSGTRAAVGGVNKSIILPANVKRDAKYYYYLHGPLARVLFGDKLTAVQGVDYAYTLQSWIKGINSTNLSYAKDISGDGNPSLDGSSISTVDALGYALHYYGNSDYAPVVGANPFADASIATGFKPLYNGNVAASGINIAFPGTTTSLQVPLLYVYGYDQLNRLKRQRTFKGLNASTNVWVPESLASYQEDITYDKNGNIETYMRNGAALTEPSAVVGMDNLTYNYNKDPLTNRKVNNRLRSVNDNVDPARWSNDLDNQTAADNYQYDAIGNLVNEGTTVIDWTVYGKIKSITGSSNLTYAYNTSQQRVSKADGTTTTFYVRDAEGKLLALYNKVSSGPINWKEQYLYGSKRLGIWLPDIANINTATGTANTKWLDAGFKQYELTNHLDNVLATITDRRVNTTAGNLLPDVVNAQDYYPFGMTQPGRQYVSAIGYRYGFNGKENDNDVGKGAGNQQDYGMRIYDPRLGRFLSVDPITQKYPELTPYQFASNKPINSVDIDGLEGWEEIAAAYFLYELGASLITGFVAIKVHEHIVTHPTHYDNPFFIPLKDPPGSGVTDRPAPTSPVPVVLIKPDLKPRPNKKPDPVPVSPIVKNDEDDDRITLYRGVSQSEGLYYDDAKKGIATPKGYRSGNPHKDPKTHSDGDNFSIFTSWTTEKTVARRFSQGKKRGYVYRPEAGVILKKTFKRSEVIKSPVNYGEAEYLVPGVVTGATPESNGIPEIPKKPTN
jgi:RHS repeat-associated protein